MTKKENPGAGNAGAGSADVATLTKQPDSKQGTLWRYDDGGRRAAGFKGTTGDCVARATTIATRMEYRDVYSDLTDLGWRCRQPWNPCYHPSYRDFWLKHNDSYYYDPDTDTHLFEEDFRQGGEWRDPDDDSAIADYEARRRIESYLSSLGWE